MVIAIDEGLWDEEHDREAPAPDLPLQQRLDALRMVGAPTVGLRGIYV